MKQEDPTARKESPAFRRGEEVNETQQAVLANASRMHMAPKRTLAKLVRYGLVEEGQGPVRTPRGEDLIEWARRTERL